MTDRLLPPPTLSELPLAQGPGWRARRLVCRAGPATKPVEERHRWTSVAVVATGTFSYRSRAGRELLGPGALLLCNAGDHFACGHEHGTGDTCVSFQFDPDYVEQANTRFRTGDRRRFVRHRIPPLPSTVALTARIRALTADAGGTDELAVRLLEAATCLVDPGAREHRSDPRAARRVDAALRAISAHPQRSWSLSGLALELAVDPFTLLRQFRRHVGVTPYQYVLRQRLECAARMLLESTDPVQDVALSCGFNDLSEFNRRFRRLLGMAPSNFRGRRKSGGEQN